MVLSPLEEKTKAVGQAPRSFKKTCKLALSSQTARHPNHWAKEKWLHESRVRWPCYLCGLDFASRQAAAVHAFKAHGIKSSIRRKIDGTQCPVCLREFSSRSRLVTHAGRASPRCKAVLDARPPILTEEEAEALDALERGQSRALAAVGKGPDYAAVPFLRAEGPLCWDACRECDDVPW